MRIQNASMETFIRYILNKKVSIYMVSVRYTNSLQKERCADGYVVRLPDILMMGRRGAGDFCVRQFSLVYEVEVPTCCGACCSTFTQYQAD